MKSEELIKKGDNILADIESLNDKIYKRLIKFLSGHIKNGKVVINDEGLAIVEDIVYGTIKETEYEKDITKYLAIFQGLENSIIKEHVEINRLQTQAIRDLWKGNRMHELLINKTVYDLGQAGMKDYFVKGVSSVIRDVNFKNMTFQDAANQLEKVLIKDNYTKQYVNGTARDALSMYRGAMHDAVAKAYDFHNWMYIGNPVEQSRPFCLHIHNKYNNRLTEEQVRAVLEEYCPNGTPSQVYETITTIQGKTKNAKKGSGMFEGTRYENFGQCRGGFSCRHEAIPTGKFYTKPKQK